MKPEGDGSKELLVTELQVLKQYGNVYFASRRRHCTHITGLRPVFLYTLKAKAEIACSECNRASGEDATHCDSTVVNFRRD